MAGGEVADSPYMVGFQHIGFPISLDSFFVTFLFLQAIAGLLEDFRIGMVHIRYFFIDA